MNSKKIRVYSIALLLASMLLFASTALYSVYQFEMIGKIKSAGPEDPLEAWSEASYIVWKYNNTHYVARNMSTLIAEFGPSTNATTILLSVKNAMTSGIIFLKDADYTVYSTFPDTDVFDSIILEGSGRNTRFLPSGSFDAIDTSKIRVSNLLWRNSYGKDYYVSTLASKVLTSFDQTKLTVKEADLTPLFLEFEDFSAWGTNFIHTSLNQKFYVGFSNATSHQTYLLVFDKNGNYINSTKYTDFGMTCMVASSDETALYAGEMINTTEIDPKLVEINPLTLVKTNRVTFDETIIRRIWGIVEVGDYLYVSGSPAPAPNEGPRLFKVNKNVWSIGQIDVTSWGLYDLYGGIYVPESGYIYFGGHGNTKGRIRVSDDLVSAWNVGSFVFTVYAFALNRDDKTIMAGEAGSATGANQVLHKYHYDTDTYESISLTNPQAGKWGGYYHRYLYGTFQFIGNDAYFNTQGGSRQYYWDYGSTWIGYDNAFDIAIGGGVNLELRVAFEGQSSVTGIFDDGQKIYFVVPSSGPGSGAKVLICTYDFTVLEK